MIENSLRYLVVSDNESLNALLNAEFGEIVQYVDELELVDTYVQKYWPNAIIIDIETTQASAEWFYSLRQQFPIAEIPLIIFQQQVDTVFEQQMSHLNRVSILSESDLQAVTTFVEILMDEYVRDPFYERESQLITLEGLPRCGYTTTVRKFTIPGTWMITVRKKVTEYIWSMVGFGHHWS